MSQEERLLHLHLFRYEGSFSSFAVVEPFTIRYDTITCACVSIYIYISNKKASYRKRITGVLVQWNLGSVVSKKRIACPSCTAEKKCQFCLDNSGA